MLIGPERGAVEIVEKPVAVGPEERHPIRRRQKRGLFAGPVARLGLCLAEARSETDGAPGAEPRQDPDGFDRHVPVHPDEGRVGRAGQILQPSEGGDAAHGLSRRVNGPDLAAKADLPALVDHVRAPDPAADHGDGLGTQQPVETARHGPAPALSEGAGRSAGGIWGQMK